MKIDFLHCNACGKCVSTGFIAVPTDTPDEGIIVRAWIECPECMIKYANTYPRPSGGRRKGDAKERPESEQSKDTKVP